MPLAKRAKPEPGKADSVDGKPQQQAPVIYISLQISQSLNIRSSAKQLVSVLPNCLRTCSDKSKHY
jgi:hypothetical protein